jgi:hypothetical protein
MASKLRFEVSRSVITVQREFHARFKKDIILVWCVFFKPFTKLTLQCNDRSGHLKTEHTQSLLLLQRQLGNWSCGPAISMITELWVALEKSEQFPLLTVYGFLLTLETAPLFCLRYTYINICVCVCVCVCTQIL